MQKCDSTIYLGTNDFFSESAIISEDNKRKLPTDWFNSTAVDATAMEEAAVPEIDKIPTTLIILDGLLSVYSGGTISTHTEYQYNLGILLKFYLYIRLTGKIISAGTINSPCSFTI